MVKLFPFQGVPSLAPFGPQLAPSGLVPSDSIAGLPSHPFVSAILLHLIVIVGTKCEESALVEILFSCCCRWFFPITSPAVHELVRKVTMAEHTATMRYLMNAFMFCFISNTIFKC